MAVAVPGGELDEGIGERGLGSTALSFQVSIRLAMTAQWSPPSSARGRRAVHRATGPGCRPWMSALTA